MLPYDRTLLTKVIATGDASKFLLRGQEFLTGADIDYSLGRTAKSIDSKTKIVTLDDGAKISYDKLCIATGGQARKPTIKGVELENVHPVRNHKD